MAVKASESREIAQHSIIDYLFEHQESFADLAFNQVDSLVLATLSYLNFSAYAEKEADGNDAILVSDALRFTDLDELVPGGWTAKAEDMPRYLHALMRSKRYRNLSVSRVVKESSQVNDKQFAAMVFHVDDIDYVAFRGTDDSLAGWNEDFNMAYLAQTPSQGDALVFLERALKDSKANHVFVGGHSKGGNLAQYASAMVTDEAFARLDAIFDHDGPGFSEAPSARIDEPAYRAKLHKTVPTFSVVGMLMESHGDFQVVESSESGTMQHMPLSWQVDDADFRFASELDASARFVDETFDRWIAGLPSDQREVVVETVFDMLEAEGAQSLTELGKQAPATFMKLVREGSRLSESARKALIEAVKSLGGSALSSAKGQGQLAIEAAKLFRDSAAEGAKAQAGDVLEQVANMFRTPEEIQMRRETAAEDAQRQQDYEAALRELGGE